MALIQCRECGKQYSDFAEQCPSCACPTIHQAKGSNASFESINPEPEISSQEDKDKSPESETAALISRGESRLERETSEDTCELLSSSNRKESSKKRDSILSKEVIPSNPSDAADGCIRTLLFIFIGGLLFLLPVIIMVSNRTGSKDALPSKPKKDKTLFDPAVSMQNKVIYYPDSRFPYLNTNDYKLVTGDLARIQYRMLRNRRNAKNFPSVLIGNGRWKNSKCNSSLPTLGLYMYSPACKHLITVNYLAGSLVYEHQIEVITTIAHEWGHHMINMSRRLVSGSQNEILSDCFAGVYLAYLDKYNLVTETEAINSIKMMGQIGNTHGTGIHGTPSQRINAITSAAMFMSDPSNVENQNRWNNFCKGLENIIDISKGLP